MLGKMLQTHRVNNFQSTFTCSKSAIKTLEKGVKYIQVTNKNTRTTSLTSLEIVSWESNITAIVLLPVRCRKNP